MFTYLNRYFKTVYYLYNGKCYCCEKAMFCLQCCTHIVHRICYFGIEAQQFTLHGCHNACCIHFWFLNYFLECHNTTDEVCTRPSTGYSPQNSHLQFPGDPSNSAHVETAHVYRSYIEACEYGTLCMYAACQVYQALHDVFVASGVEP